MEEVASYTVPVKGEKKPVGFDYIYEQATWEPETRQQTVKVHFRFEDDSWIREAFTYDWRVWNFNELQRCMKAVGFARTAVFIDGYDEDHNYRHNVAPTQDWEEQVKEEEFYSGYVVAYKT